MKIIPLKSKFLTDINEKYDEKRIFILDNPYLVKLEYWFEDILIKEAKDNNTNNHLHQSSLSLSSSSNIKISSKDSSINILSSEGT